jgi:hypothetical protein
MGAVMSNRALTSTLAALALAAILPQAGLAQSNGDAGIWRVNMARSTFGPSYNTMVIERMPSAGAAGNGAFVVISGGYVYRVNGAARGMENWKDMDLEMIGYDARASSTCRSRCEAITVTYRAYSQS